MFHTSTNASKVAFHFLVEFINKWNFDFIDCQVTTNHMMSLGGRNISRNEFLELLDNAIINKSLTGNWGLLI